MTEAENLVARLRAKTHESDGLHGIFEIDRNPDGPAAAAELERLSAEVGRLREALGKIAAGDYDNFAGDPGKWADLIARAALSGEC